MTLYSRKVSKSIEIGIWKLTETLEELESKYSPKSSEIGRYRLISNETRKREWLATRILLRLMLNSDFLISYDKAGKPCINEISKEISITHTSDFVGVAISDKPCGLDIESLHRRYERITSKFLHYKNEQWMHAQTSNQDDRTYLLTLIWVCKETLYKILSDKYIDLQNETYIEENESLLSANTIEIHYETEKRRGKNNIHIEMLPKDYILAYGVDNDTVNL
ncbi:MAG: 4'-phosphopantetheinyl transferase family protein [Bacteroidales bacterium]